MFNQKKVNEMNKSGTKTGKVKFYNPAKGFGFIIDDETDQEIFMHATGIASDTSLSSITSEKRVSFEVIDGKKGLNAVNVQVLSN